MDHSRWQIRTLRKRSFYMAEERNFFVWSFGSSAEEIASVSPSAQRHHAAITAFATLPLVFRVLFTP
jgi:hypothetical protein